MIRSPGQRRLDGRVAMVAGSDSAIGRASVERFAAEGASIHPAAEETGLGFDGVVRGCLDAFGRLDLLVVAPAHAVVEPLPRASLERCRAALDGGLRTTFFIAQAAARVMTEGGRICVAAPRRSGRIAAHMPAPATIVEGGLVAMVRLLAVELAPNGIAVNAVCPIGPQADPRAVASALAFLASAGASYVSGASVPVFGLATDDPTPRP
jgi:NAD(P)-dependent dehydrogenase (short-subunit alcohol dehydrogenase family)